jgi:hypothetical protein
VGLGVVVNLMVVSHAHSSALALSITRDGESEDLISEIYVPRLVETVRVPVVANMKIP